MQNERVTDEMKLHALDLLSAPSAEEKAVEVKKLEWRQGYRDAGCDIVQASTLPFYQIRTLDGVIWLDVDNHQTVYPSVAAAKSAAQQDYEMRIRSALVDIPAVESEPVAWAYPETLARIQAKREKFEQHTLSLERCGNFTVPLYTHPPRSSLIQSDEGEIAAKALMAAYEEFNRIACEGVTEARNVFDALERCHFFANRGATDIRAALSRKTAAPGDGSAIGTSDNSKGN